MITSQFQNENNQLQNSSYSIAFLVISKSNQAQKIAQESQIFYYSIKLPINSIKNEQNNIIKLNLNNDGQFVYNQQNIISIKLQKKQSQFVEDKNSQQFPFQIKLICQNQSNKDFQYLQNKNQINFQTFLVSFQKNSFKISQTLTNKNFGQIQLSELSENSFSSDCKLIHQNNHIIWILDQNQMILHRINLQILIQTQITNKIDSILINQSNQLKKNHQNTIKMLNLRLKILNIIQKYLTSSLNPDFPSCLRLMNNQENLLMLNDSINYLVEYILNRYNSKKQFEVHLNQITMEKFEINIIKILSKLIQSKYESHIQTGIQNLINFYDFNKPHSNEIRLHYVKIAESGRIQKLLNQEKKKALFELAYRLKAKINGNLF